VNTNFLLTIYLRQNRILSALQLGVNDRQLKVETKMTRTMTSSQNSTMELAKVQPNQSHVLSALIQYPTEAPPQARHYQRFSDSCFDKATASPKSTSTSTDKIQLPRKSQLKIVLIDDSTELTQLMKFCLNSGQFKVVSVAHNPKQGLLAAAEHKPDIILLDQNMPGGKGVDIVHLLVEEVPGVVIILATTSGNETIIQTAMARGAKGYIQKPFEPMALAKKIDQIYREAMAAKVCGIVAG
jgi:CheY-like chemotaxis protein